MSVALRMALQRDPDVALGTIATLAVALVVALVAVVAEAPARGLHLGSAWPFLLAGLLSPGLAQIFVTVGIRESGASRVSMVFGTAPLVSVTIALIFLNEPVQAPLVSGAVLIVGGWGGACTRARSPGAPQPARPRLAFARRHAVRDPGQPRAAPRGGEDRRAARSCRGCRAPRRDAHRRVWARRRISRRWLPFVPAGLLFGGSYVALFEAYYRGRVTVVAPLVAIESLVGVALSAVFSARSELVGKRLVFGAALIVAGARLIGAFR